MIKLLTTLHIVKSSSGYPRCLRGTFSDCHLAMATVIRFQEKVYLIGPLDPVFDKNHESGVIFDGFCDHFCANLEMMSYHAPKWAFNAFSRVFKRKLGLPSRAKLFSCSHCTTFVVTTFSVSATISAQILELCAKIAYKRAFVSAYRFSRVFKRKLVLRSSAKLFSCKNCTTFVFTPYHSSARTSAKKHEET
jgi:RNase P subunit RPR2